MPVEDPLTTRAARGAVTLGYYDWVELLRLIDDEDKIDEERIARIRTHVAKRTRTIRRRFSGGRGT